MPARDITLKVKRKELGNDVLLNKPWKASGAFNERELGEFALNGNNTSKWCTRAPEGNDWLEVDAEEVIAVNQWFVMHAGSRESASWNTREFKLEYKVNETDEWKVADYVKDNEESMTLRDFPVVEGRYFRLWIEQATQDVNDRTTRIYMFRVFSV